MNNDIVYQLFFLLKSLPWVRLWDLFNRHFCVKCFFMHLLGNIIVNIDHINPWTIMNVPIRPILHNHGMFYCCKPRSNIYYTSYSYLLWHCKGHNPAGKLEIYHDLAEGPSPYDS